MSRIVVFLGVMCAVTFIGCQTTTDVVSVPVTEQIIAPVEQIVVEPVQVVPDPPIIEPEPPEPIEPIDPLVVYFERDSSELSERTQLALRALSYVVLQNMDVVQEVDIVGHVAFAGTAAGRVRIAQERSDKVKAYMVETGVPASLIRAVSAGADQPVATNDTAEGRALNRRAQITVTQEQI